jgi:competence protein ComEA
MIAILGVVLALGLIAASGGAGKAGGRTPFAKRSEVRPGDPKIDLNTATAQELMRLPGIGRKRAEAILALREKRPFRRVREIRRVRGIGRKTFQRLLPYIMVGEARGKGAKRP